MVRKRVPVHHAWLLQGYGPRAAEWISEHLSGSSQPGTVLGLGARKWKKLSPILTFALPFPLALDISDFLLFVVYLPSIGHDCDL